jgi:dTDP-4-dehydrorhamnose reductase
MQWMDGVLSQGQQVEFFNDEFRCPVYVKDMVDVVLSLTKTWLSGMSLTCSICGTQSVAILFLVFTL